MTRQHRNASDCRQDTDPAVRPDTDPCRGTGDEAAVTATSVPPLSGGPDIHGSEAAHGHHHSRQAVSRTRFCAFPELGPAALRQAKTECRHQGRSPACLRGKSGEIRGDPPRLRREHVLAGDRAEAPRRPPHYGQGLRLRRPARKEENPPRAAALKPGPLRQRPAPIQRWGGERPRPTEQTALSSGSKVVAYYGGRYPASGR
jgi:hypothetical protein